MTARTSATGVAAALAPVLGVALSVLAGCESGDSGEDAAPASPSALVEVSRPHFEGSRAVTVQTGRVIYSEEACDPDPADDRVCAPDGSRTYLAFGDPARVALTEARMDPADGNTTWTATVAFATADAGQVRRAFREAAATGAVVLVLDESEQVLLPAPVTEFDGRRIVFENLTKPEAWDLVERFETG